MLTKKIEEKLLNSENYNDYEFPMLYIDDMEELKSIAEKQENLMNEMHEIIKIQISQLKKEYSMACRPYYFGHPGQRIKLKKELNKKIIHIKKVLRKYQELNNEN
jgi:hypothetical protein